VEKNTELYPNIDALASQPPCPLLV
jgi:hypothetical protein